MQTQFDFLIDLARQYHEFNENNNSLFAAINSLSREVMNEIFDEYGDPERDFKPVNLLRAEIARIALNNERIEEIKIEEIKEKIRNRDTNYFSSYSDNLKEGLKNYKETKGKGDYFTAWNVSLMMYNSIQLSLIAYSQGLFLFLRIQS
ncbi:MAG TPA: hypothetical protein GX710_05100 [Clostridiales bacterium]|nr:hypothetical protein [Clostridiales bacterium]